MQAEKNRTSLKQQIEQGRRHIQQLERRLAEETQLASELDRLETQAVEREMKDQEAQKSSSNHDATSTTTNPVVAEPSAATRVHSSPPVVASSSTSIPTAMTTTTHPPPAKSIQQQQQTPQSSRGTSRDPPERMMIDLSGFSSSDDNEDGNPAARTTVAGSWSTTAGHQVNPEGKINNSPVQCPYAAAGSARVDSGIPLLDINKDDSKRQGSRDRGSTDFRFTPTMENDWPSLFKVGRENCWVTSRPQKDLSDKLTPTSSKKGIWNLRSPIRFCSVRQ